MATYLAGESYRSQARQDADAEEDTASDAGAEPPSR
jgi:hypothetical protein